MFRGMTRVRSGQHPAAGSGASTAFLQAVWAGVGAAKWDSTLALRSRRHSWEMTFSWPASPGGWPHGQAFLKSPHLGNPPGRQGQILIDSGFPQHLVSVLCSQQPHHTRWASGSGDNCISETVSASIATCSSCWPFWARGFPLGISTRTLSTTCFRLGGHDHLLPEGAP